MSDFGLAKQLGADSGHTATGEVIGTPAYMAPEQAEGKTDAVGPACDVYALGAILYECLTGRPPFKANTVLETLRQVITRDPPPPRDVRPAVPPDLEAVCLRCLEKNPRHRYATAEALADDLRRFLNGQPVAARPLSVVARGARWVRRNRYVVGAVLLVLVAALAAGAAGTAREYVERERVRRRAVELAPQAREILHRHCFECHGADPARAERRFLVLDRASLLDPHRRNVVPGRPADSRLIQRIEDGTMPPEEDELHLPRVSERELAILKEWIAGGAPEFPEGDAGGPPVAAEHPLAAGAKAVFVEHCYRCHRVAEAGGGIKILNHPLLISQRKVVIPGKPDESELYQLLVTTDENLMMPPQTEPRLTPEEIATVRRWIEASAPPFPRTPK